MKQTATFITYSSVTQENDHQYVNRALGRFLDSVSHHFDEVHYVASRAEGNSSLYEEGRSIYNYTFKSENIRTVEIQNVENLGFFKRILVTFKNLGRLKQIIKKSQFLFIYMPGVTGLLCGFMASFHQKPYGLYFGADWSETASFRFRKLSFAKAIQKIMISVYSWFEKPCVKKSRFCLVAGKKLFHFYSRMNEKTYETAPLLPFDFEASNHSYEKKHTIDKNHVRLLFVGPLQPRKGLEYLIEAVSLLRKREIFGNLDIVGSLDSAYKALLDNIIKEHSLHDQVCFVGYLSDPEKRSESVV